MQKTQKPPAFLKKQMAFLFLIFFKVLSTLTLGRYNIYVQNAKRFKGEGNETPEECCVREAAEETGLLVKPKSCFLVINEFYEDWKFVSYYFVCEVEGHTDRNPTKREIEVGAVPEWLEIGQAAEIFSHYGDYAGSDEERRGIYLREHLALSVFLDKYN